MPEYYGTIDEATEYLAGRPAWENADPADHPKALFCATQIIDTLNYKGTKSTEMEFPRGADTEVPVAIRQACYEIACALLDGKDAETELENLAVSSQGYSSARTVRAQIPIDHLINGVPSAMAWRLLRPFLRDGDAITFQ